MDGRGEAIAVRANYTLVSSAEPARPGEPLFIYVSGLNSFQRELGPTKPSGEDPGQGIQPG